MRFRIKRSSNGFTCQAKPERGQGLWPFNLFWRDMFCGYSDLPSEFPTPEKAEEAIRSWHEHHYMGPIQGEVVKELIL